TKILEAEEFAELQEVFETSRLTEIEQFKEFYQYVFESPHKDRMGLYFKKLIFLRDRFMLRLRENLQALEPEEATNFAQKIRDILTNLSTFEQTYVSELQKNRGVSAQTILTRLAAFDAAHAQWKQSQQAVVQLAAQQPPLPVEPRAGDIAPTRPVPPMI